MNSASRYSGKPRSRRASRNGVTSPPRPKMMGTVLPQDSMRGLRNGNYYNMNTDTAPLPPPPPSTATTTVISSTSTASSSPAFSPHGHHIKLLAAAGRDLFRQGLAFDGVSPTKKQEPRHPAVKPNLLSIPENDSVMASGAATPSELIVIVGGPLNNRGEPGVWVANRIAHAIQLYWQILLAFNRDDQDEEEDGSGAMPLCYVVPTGGESTDEGIVETETIRNALVSTGVSPHHIVMDCTATSLVDNALQLVSVLRQLHVRRVHVVTSAFQVARVRLVYEQLLRSAAVTAAGDVQGVELLFHGARDGLSAADRAERQASEHALLQTTQTEIDRTLQRLREGKATRRTSGRRTKTNTTTNNHQARRRPTFHSDV